MQSMHQVGTVYSGSQPVLYVTLKYNVYLQPLVTSQVKDVVVHTCTGVLCTDVKFSYSKNNTNNFYSRHDRDHSLFRKHCEYSTVSCLNY